MKRRLVNTIIISLLTASTFVGCGNKEGLEQYSKSELIEAYETLSTGYDELMAEKNNIETLYNALTVDTLPTAAIGYVGDATGAITFNSRDAKIIFPSTFQYPGAQQIKANNNIMISDGIFVAPGTNWIVKLNGTTLEMEHSNGISGIIKIGQADIVFDSNQLRDEVLAPWFTEISNSKITYSDLFTSDSSIAIGVDATVPILIDSEDAFLRCGMAAINGKTVTYIFTYRSQQDMNKDESIINVINSIQVDGQMLKVNS